MIKVILSVILAWLVVIVLFWVISAQSRGDICQKYGSDWRVNRAGYSRYCVNSNGDIKGF